MLGLHHLARQRNTVEELTECHGTLRGEASHGATDTTAAGDLAYAPTKEHRP